MLINNKLRIAFDKYSIHNLKTKAMLATLKFPVLGFTEIRLLIKRDCKWLAELIGADLEIEVSDSDFVLL